MNVIEPDEVKLMHRDCPGKFVGKERRAARAGGLCQRRDAVRRASQDNPERAGRFWPIAASLVGHYALAWLPSRSLHWAKIGSVTIHQLNLIRL
jgi:hypothetical protein